jgi:hypothetical protein
MADIRDSSTSASWNTNGAGSNSPLQRARATSQDRASDLNRAQMGASVDKNIEANKSRRYGVDIFGRLHNQQWDCIESAQECADKIGGTLVDLHLEYDIEITINLTQHPATPDQGVTEPENKAAVQAALTFDAIPSSEDMKERADFLARIAKDSGASKAMIGGAPFFMSTLEKALLDVGIKPVYAFSVRESVEKTTDDGTVTKTNVFKHTGFVEIQ